MDKNPQKILPALFFLSGSSALMFEVIWQRYMVLAFGASAPAITAILTAFLCGIAFGSWAGGKIVKRVKNVIRLYGFVELWIFISAVSVPWLLNIADIFQLKIFHALPSESFNFFALRFVLAIAVVLPATLGMGATIPIMNRIIFNRYRITGLSVSLAYGMNTIGSVVGCLLAGFILIRHFGLLQSTFIAGSFNVIIFLIIFFVLEETIPVDDEKLSAKPEAANLKTWESGHPYGKLMIGLYAAGGFLALGYEVLWFRLLGIFTSNSIITFTVGLAVYLLGFSSGSLFVYPALVRHISPKRIFFLSNWGAGAASIGLIPFYYIISHYYETAAFLQNFGHRSNTFPLLVVKETVVAVILMMIPAILMGLAYPAVCHATIRKDEEIGDKSGCIYFLGSLGAALGAVTVGQWIIPRLNLMGTVAFLSTASLGIGLITLMFEEKPLRIRKPLLAGCSLALMVIVLYYGAFGRPIIKEGRLVKEERHWIFKDQKPGETISLIRYRSGPSGTISVLHGEGVPDGPVRMIYVDGQPIAATETWMKTDAKLLAHIPLMLHPNPKRAITVGYGTGITSWSMMQYGVETDCVEIEPEVYRSTHLFADHNHYVDRLSGFRIIINDARNYFRLTDKKYDIISTDVTNLNYKNNSSLYTKEYFKILKSRLTENGIVSAWVPMGGISNFDYKILLKTFQSVFSHSSVWFAGQKETSYYSILVGTPKVLAIDYARLKNLFKQEALNKDLEEAQILDPLKLLSLFLIDEDGIRRYAGDVPVHTDDRPVLEFYPLNHFNQEVYLGEIYYHILDDPVKYILNLNDKDRDVMENFLAGEGVLCNRSGECKNIDELN